jgi:hypothetical protein
MQEILELLAFALVMTGQVLAVVAAGAWQGMPFATVPETSVLDSPGPAIEPMREAA